MQLTLKCVSLIASEHFSVNSVSISPGAERRAAHREQVTFRYRQIGMTHFRNTVPADIGVTFKVSLQLLRSSV